MSKKNPVQRIEIFRWKAESNYAILVSRKHGTKVYQSVKRSRAQSVENVCISTYDGNNRRFASTPSSVCAIYCFEPKTQPITVYFVQIGQDGYMPDSVSAYPTLKRAYSAAIEEKRIALDNWFDNEVIVEGNIREHMAYKVICDGSYRYSIRIIPECVNGSSVPAFTGNLYTRADLESFCDWYNEQM